MFIEGKWYQSKATQIYFLCVSGNPKPKFRQLGRKGLLVGTDDGEIYGINTNMFVLVPDIMQKCISSEDAEEMKRNTSPYTERFGGA